MVRRRASGSERAAEQGGEGFELGPGDGFIKRDADPGGIDAAKIEPGGDRGVHQGIRARADFEGDGVVVVRVAQRVAALHGGGGEQARLEIDPPGDPLQALRPVPYRIHAGDDGEQHLRGADVRGRLFAADMLLAGLQGEAHGRRAGGVEADADEAAGHRALQRVPRGEKGGMRAAETHRHAEALRGADDDVGAHRARGRQQHQAERIGGHDGERAQRMGGVDLGAEVADGAGATGILQHHGEGFGGGDGGGIASRRVDQRDAERPGPRGEHGAGVRVEIIGQRDDVGPGLGHAVRHRHRLGGSGGFVEQRGVGDVEAGEFADHGLEIDQRLEPALGDFGLIGGVGGVPARVLQHVAQHHRRGVGAVIAEADEGFFEHVALGEAAQFGDGGGLVDGVGQVHGALGADAAGHDAGGEVVECCGTDDGKHLRDVGVRGGDVAGDETVGGFEFGEFGEVLHHSVSSNAW